MKRDWDVVRGILIALEQNSTVKAIESLPDVDNEIFVYHMTILCDGEFVHGKWGHRNGKPYASALRLTWSGHELLDKMRDEKLWERIKKAVEEKSLSMSFEVIGLIAKQIAKNKLGVDLD